MSSNVRLHLHGLVVALTAGAAAVALAPAQAATIAEGVQLSSGIALDLSGSPRCAAVGGFGTRFGRFTGSGPEGSGHAACGDKTSVQIKDASTPHPYGRYDPEGDPWIDSNDLTHIDWDLDAGAGVTAVSFALIDAHDQADSFFRIAVDGETWSLPSREADGTLHLISILFDRPVRTATITFDTRHNDGFGLTNIKVAPVPLPPALLLSASGLLLMAAARRRRIRPD